MAETEGILKKKATIAELPPVTSTSADAEQDAAFKKKRDRWMNNKKKKNRKDAIKKNNSQGSKVDVKVVEKAKGKCTSSMDTYLTWL